MKILICFFLFVSVSQLSLSNQLNKDSIINNAVDKTEKNKLIKSSVPFLERLSLLCYGGYYYNIISDDGSKRNLEGYMYGIGIEYFFYIDKPVSIEISRFQFPGSVDFTEPSYEGLHAYSFVVNYYFNNIFKNLSLKCHLGMGGKILLPLISWDIGLEIGYKINKFVEIGINGRYLLDLASYMQSLVYPSFIGLNFSFKL